MKIAMAQVNTQVGAFERNIAQVLEAVEVARDQGARLVVTPELAVTGYFPGDLLTRRDFVQEAFDATREIGKRLPRGIAVALGTVIPQDGQAVGIGLYNGAAIFDDGCWVATAYKQLLPTYDVFDEARYFDRGHSACVVGIDGVKVGVTICEDLWNDAGLWAHPRYRHDPVAYARAFGAQVVVNLSASPYALEKPAMRERVACAAARRHGVPVVLTNLAGGNDSLLFDGQSFAVDHLGCVTSRIRPAFREGVTQVVDVQPRDASWGSPEAIRTDARMTRMPMSPVQPAEMPLWQRIEVLEALTCGLRDYARKTGFRSAVLGLSGGVDSALVAVIAARALGPENVHCLAMPSRFTSSMSNEDAETLACRLGAHFYKVPIGPALSAQEGTLSEALGGPVPPVAAENLQARIRGAYVMAFANAHGHLALTTGNKSEIATGYCTLYGDMAGGLAVIGDLLKTLVYELAWTIPVWGPLLGVMPERILTRAPSAELRENQTDQDTLPPYEVLDRILLHHIEGDLDAAGIARCEPNIPRQTIDRVLDLVRRSEHKRRQGAPVLRVTSRAFGAGWQIPLASSSR